MSVTAEKTLRELVLEIPAATGVFERLGLDYCCGGSRTLGEACRAANVPFDRVIDSLADGTAGGAAMDRDWRIEPLAKLIAHIQDTHHKYVRTQIARLGPLFDKVCSVHGENHPELARMRATFAGLAEELTSHLRKEEMVLFPYIERMEEAAMEKAPAAPPPFGSVKNPVAMMMRDHDEAGEALRDLRQAGCGYMAPPDACVSYQALYKALPQFEADLHRHIHLENNILFPRAVEMERLH